MNDLQNSKLQLIQEELSALQATLRMKKRELQQMKRLARGETDQMQVTTITHALQIMSVPQVTLSPFLPPDPSKQSGERI